MNLFLHKQKWKKSFSNFSCMFLNPNIFSNLNSNCSNLSDLRNLHEQVKKTFCCQKLFWPFTVWINYSSDLKNFENSRPSASNFKTTFFLTVGQNNFGNKIQQCVTFPFVLRGKNYEGQLGIYLSRHPLLGYKWQQPQKWPLKINGLHRNIVCKAIRKVNSRFKKWAHLASYFSLYLFI
mgnify:CR=1 FL=1